MKGNMEACLESGMEDYLSKSIKVEELERALRRWRELRQPLSI